jgi:transposase-like protein
MELPDDFPTTELEFEEQFRDEVRCREYLVKLRWPEGFQCPKCQGVSGWQLKGRDLVECTSCGRQTSLTAGTILHGTRKPLRLWFRAMFLMAAQKSGLSAKNFMRIMGMRSYKTAWTWLHKLRHAMVRQGRPKLEGKVEVDETYIGGPVEGKVGRGTTNPMVVIAIEKVENGDHRYLGRVRMEVVEDGTQPSLFTFVSENVTVGSSVVTDGNAAFNELPLGGYRHSVKVIGHDTKSASSKLPGVHRIAALVKRWILGTHQGSVADNHLQAYLDEFTFRFNRRRSSHPVKLFHRLAQQVMLTKPFPYDALIAAAAPCVP